MQSVQESITSDATQRPVPGRIADQYALFMDPDPDPYPDPDPDPDPALPKYLDKGSKS